MATRITAVSWGHRALSVDLSIADGVVEHNSKAVAVAVGCTTGAKDGGTGKAN